MGYKHSHDEILTAAVDEAFAGGLSALTFARVARRAGTSDRIVVYYFPSKDELIAAVLAALGVRLQAALAAVFDVTEAVEANFSTRVKMAQTSNVMAVAMMGDGKVLFAQKEIKVTLGGCGG